MFLLRNSPGDMMMASFFNLLAYITICEHSCALVACIIAQCVKTPPVIPASHKDTRIGRAAARTSNQSLDGILTADYSFKYSTTVPYHKIYFNALFT